MSSIHLTVPTKYACQKCKQPASEVKVDKAGVVTFARCDACKDK